MSGHDDERSRLMAEQERLLRAGVPIEALAKLDDVAPAVPVGVPPEPAEGAHTWVESTGDWRPDGLGQIRPAVPVVHREPGDRAEEWVLALNDISGPNGILDDAQILAALMPVADAEVAAAVAAVRADTAAKIERMVEALTRAIGLLDSAHVDRGYYEDLVVVLAEVAYE